MSNSGISRPCSQDVHQPLIQIQFELIGNFKNSGQSWQLEPIPVNDHDFHIDAEGQAIPYGIYDDQQNRGYVFIGTSYETPAFAVDSIVEWWCSVGRERYPEAQE